MRQLECALRKSLATPTKLEERFGDLSVNWRTSNIAESGRFMDEPYCGKDSISHSCDCSSDAARQWQGIRMRLGRRLRGGSISARASTADHGSLAAEGRAQTSASPLTNALCIHITRSAMETFGQSLEKLLSYLKKDSRSKQAAQCLASSVDFLAETHDAFIGPWGSNYIISKLIPDMAISTTTAFVGRPGNPLERSFTVETELGTDTLASNISI